MASSDVNKDQSHKDQDKDKDQDQTFKDKDKDFVKQPYNGTRTLQGLASQVGKAGFEKPRFFGIFSKPKNTKEFQILGFFIFWL